VTAPVEFFNSDEGIQPEAEVVEVQCEPAGEDPMGELRKGGSWLVLRGRLIPAKMRFKQRKEGEELKPFNVVDLDVLDGGHLKNLWVDDDCRWLMAEQGSEQPTVYCLVVGRKLPRKEVLCLVLARTPEEEDSGESDQAAADHVYRRIGMLEIFGGPPRPVLWGWLHELYAKGEETTVKII